MKWKEIKEGMMIKLPKRDTPGVSIECEERAWRAKGLLTPQLIKEPNKEHVRVERYFGPFGEYDVIAYLLVKEIGQEFPNNGWSKYAAGYKIFKVLRYYKTGHSTWIIDWKCQTRIRVGEIGRYHYPSDIKRVPY